MPQPCSTLTPCTSVNVLIMLNGTAEPPIRVFFSVGTFLPVWARWLRSRVHTVGTPAASVTPSVFMRSTSVSASPIFGPGNTSFVPVIAALYGSPQAFAWNIGTTARITSCAFNPTASLMQPA